MIVEDLQGVDIVEFRFCRCRGRLPGLVQFDEEAVGPDSPRLRLNVCATSLGGLLERVASSDEYKRLFLGNTIEF